MFRILMHWQQNSRHAMSNFLKPIKDSEDGDDGLRGFEVQDADGYVLFFGRPKEA
jgi:hypothetical protein